MSNFNEAFERAKVNMTPPPEGWTDKDWEDTRAKAKDDWDRMDLIYRPVWSLFKRLFRRLFC